MKRKYKYLIILLIIITLIWTLLVVTNQFKVIDKYIYNLLISLKCDFFTNFFKVITFFGSVKFIVILNVLAIIYGIIKKNNKCFRIVFFSAYSSFINSLLKVIVKRERPDISLWLVSENNFSFPSGHSMTSFVFYGIICYFIYNSKISLNNKIVIISLLGLLVILIGMSRIYLGVHYFSDVIGGFLWGFVVLLLGINYLNRREIE